MKRILIVGVIGVLTLGAGPLTRTAAADGVPTRDIEVSGTGVGSYPAFDPEISRYAVTTTDQTAGSVEVTASTSDPNGDILVDGRPSVGPTADVHLAGLSDGDEISVIVDDSAGRTAYSLIYLPAGFPTLTATAADPSAVAPGDVFLTLTDWTGASPSYEAAVDSNGVPVYARADGDLVPLNLEAEPNGHYSVARGPSAPGQVGVQIHELDGSFHEIATHATIGELTSTDGHDAILEPNGDAWLLSTDANPDTGYQDAVIQEQAPDGHVLFQWDSADHVDLSRDGLGVGADYAHINSIQIMDNGDVLASFRHLSQVMEIATHPHDGFRTGQVVWRLGGRRSTFSFPDDPYGGPCAQHTASQLPNGDILVFDDGSTGIGGSPLLCVDPNNPNGPTVQRVHTRMAEYSLDTTDDTAHLVWSYEDPNRQTVFAGSAQRLANGNTLMGWGSGNSPALATEVSSGGNAQPVWELRDSAGLQSYRALKFDAPDVTRPVVDLTSPADGAAYSFGQAVDADFGCTDTGGSNLQSCVGTDAVDAPIDTSTPGDHTFTVTALDGAGNSTTVTHHYTVGLPPAVYRPDATIHSLPGGNPVGSGVYGKAVQQQISQQVAPHRVARAAIVVINRGNRTERFTIAGVGGNRGLAARYLAAGKRVTESVVAGRYRTPPLAPGYRFILTLHVARTNRAKAGDQRTFAVTATSTHDTATSDAVSTRVAVRR